MVGKTDHGMGKFVWQCVNIDVSGPKHHLLSTSNPSRSRDEWKSTSLQEIGGTCGLSPIMGSSCSIGMRGTHVSLDDPRSYSTQECSSCARVDLTPPPRLTGGPSLHYPTTHIFKLHQCGHLTMPSSTTRVAGSHSKSCIGQKVCTRRFAYCFHLRMQKPFFSGAGLMWTRSEAVGTETVVTQAERV